MTTFRPSSVRDEPYCDGCAAVAGDGDPQEWVLVARNDHTATFVTDRQRSVGSLLVLPRRHVTWVGELRPDESAALATAVWTVAGALRSAFRPDGMHIWTGTGEAAGQSMFHMHIQVTPRYDGREYSFLPSTEVPVTPVESRRQQADVIAAHLARSNPRSVMA